MSIATSFKYITILKSPSSKENMVKKKSAVWILNVLEISFFCILLVHLLTMTLFCCRKKEKFTDTALSIANTKLWESRLDATEKSRLEFRDNAKRLAFDNESLQKQLMVTEKDTVDVISYLKREDQSKEDLVSWISRSSVQ